MEPGSQTDGFPAALESQIRECFGRVVYTHKAHEKTADILLTRMGRVKNLQIILSAITTGGIFSVVLGQGRGLAILSALVATTLLALNAFAKDSNPGEIAQKHKEVAAKLWDIRESYLSILADVRSGTRSVENVQEARDGLQKALAVIYESAPRTLDEAYAAAGLALKQKEELTFSDAEIDKFLPGPLRKGI